jgi:hypothetical protein
MKNCKRLLPALLALLTLTACGNSESTTALPETTEAGTISAPAVVTAGREPEEDYDLTNVLGSYQDWMYQGKWDQDPL